MISPRIIANAKRAAIPVLLISLALAALSMAVRKSPINSDTSNNNQAVSGNSQISTTNSEQALPPADHLASVTVIILNNGKELPLELKVGGKVIKIPGPSSWPPGADDGASGSDKGRFLAGIIDTADVLKANGFKPTDSFGFVVGGNELNAANTFRVTGASQPDIANNARENYVEEYKTPPGEQGIWRSLQFKNILLSYGQVPSLADFLVSPQVTPAKDTSTSGGTSAPSNQNPAAADDTSHEESLASTRKYLRGLNNPDPAIRSEAIQNLILNDYDQIKGATDPSMETLVEKTLSDTDPAVRKAALDALDMWDGSVAQQSLIQIALNDTNPELRMHALDLLVDRFAEKALPTLQQARNDPDFRVGQKASELLAQFSK